ncbi:MAG TPA: 3-deoxy-D-manno-octulosonic acid transferase, partial [Opitutaceae bacterium]
FVGKSLAPHSEGQTPVEAAALGKPILFGPGMGSFREIARDLLERGAARRVEDASDLGRQAGALLGDAAQREAISAAQAGWRRDTGGGVARTLSEIRRELAVRD